MSDIQNTVSGNNGLADLFNQVKGSVGTLSGLVLDFKNFGKEPEAIPVYTPIANPTNNQNITLSEFFAMPNFKLLAVGFILLGVAAVLKIFRK